MVCAPWEESWRAQADPLSKELLANPHLCDSGLKMRSSTHEGASLPFMVLLMVLFSPPEAWSCPPLLTFLSSVVSCPQQTWFSLLLSVCFILFCLGCILPNVSQRVAFGQLLQIFEFGLSNTVMMSLWERMVLGT